MKVIRALYLAPFFGLSTVGLGLASLVVSLFSARAARRSARFWAKINAKAAGFKIVVEGLENMIGPDGAGGDGGGFIIAANHASAADIAAILAGLPVDICWVTKAELLKIPFLGWHLRRVHIPVARRSAGAAGKFLAEAAEKIRGGAAVAIFPEGTRNRHPERLLPFKRGAFLLAKASGRPVVPTAIIGSGDLWPPKTIVPRPGTITMRLGAPIDPAGYADNELKRMADDARRAIIELMAGGPLT